MSTEAAAAVVSERVEKARVKHLCPEISWGIVEHGRLTMHGGTPDRVFRIASMTKSFTAAAVLALRDDGLLSLDEPIERAAPELAAVRPPAGSAPLTLRHLLSMSSGLATDDPWADRHLDIDEASIDRVYAAGPLFARRPGEGFEYSNLGYGMIGRVVRRITGRPVQQHIVERLLEPLGMTSTTWVMPNHDDWARPHRVVDGIAVPDDGPLLGDGEIAPMGGLWTTVTDLAKWVAWFDEAVTAPDRGDWVGLSPASRRDMQRQHTYTGLREGLGLSGPAGYGFGLLRFEDPSLGPLVGHSGGLPGYGSNMRWCLGRGIGAIALANVTYAPMAELTLQMLHHVNSVEPISEVALAPTATQVDIARRLAALVSNWSDAEADAIFADNVAPDESYERRAAAARQHAQKHGPLTVQSVIPTTAAAATAHALAADGTGVTIEFLLAPLGEPRVQRYDVSIVRG